MDGSGSHFCFRVTKHGMRQIDGTDGVARAFVAGSGCCFVEKRCRTSYRTYVKLQHAVYAKASRVLEMHVVGNKVMFSTLNLKIMLSSQTVTRRALAPPTRTDDAQGSTAQHTTPQQAQTDKTKHVCMCCMCAGLLDMFKEPLCR